MGSSSSKSAPVRSNSISYDEEPYLQSSYHTSRGNVPARLVHEQLQQAPQDQVFGQRYPGRFGNHDRDAKDERLFAEHEVRGRQLLEIPVHTTNFDFTRPNDDRQATRMFENPRPEERAQVWESEIHPSQSYNTPGVHRAVLRREPDGPPGFLGIITHPPGNYSGYERTPAQPMDRQDRQDVMRHLDRNQRQSTWPERGRNGSDYSGMEQRHQRGSAW